MSSTLTPGDPLWSGDNAPEGPTPPPQWPPAQPPQPPSGGNRGNGLGWKGWVGAGVGVLILIGVAAGSGDSDESGGSKPAKQSAKAPAVAPATAEAAEATPEPEAAIAIRKPSDGSTVRAAQTTVRGTVEPANARVKVDGRRVSVRNGRFSKVVSLDLGENAVTVEASAPGHVQDEQTRYVTRRRSAAELQRLRDKREAARQARIAALTQTFSGNGSTNIGTITIEEESVLEWTNYNPEFPDLLMFLAYDKGFGFNVSSEANSGKSVLEPGRYRSVQVSGDNWTIKISPRG